MEDQDLFEERVVPLITSSSTRNSFMVSESSQGSLRYFQPMSMSKVRHRVKLVEQILKRNLISVASDSPEYKSYFALIMQCKILTSTQNSHSVMSKLSKEIECNQNPEINKLAHKLLELAKEIEKLNLKEHCRKNSEDSNIRLNPEDISRATITCKRKLNHHRASSNAIYSNNDEKQEFFSLCLSIKLKLKPRQSAYMISISELYDKALALGLRREQWTAFIEQKFGK